MEGKIERKGKAGPPGNTAERETNTESLKRSPKNKGTGNNSLWIRSRERRILRERKS